jgi:hypothetical protein
MRTTASLPATNTELAGIPPVERFLRPYTGRLAVILGISLLSTLLGLAYISKFLIDSALLRWDSSALWRAAALMFGATILGYALNILFSYQVSARFSVHYRAQS